MSAMAASKLNTLTYDAELCCDCGRCTEVCPHGVFTRGDSAARLVHGDDCIECGACQLNCPTEAIQVESGVGCASAMIISALTGKPEQCGDEGCCS